MKILVTLASCFAIALLSLPAFANECAGGLCGTPNQSGGGGCGCGCGCGSILVALTDRGDTYQFADDFDGDGIEDEFDNCPFVSNYVQADFDSDMVGDACDVCVEDADPAQSNIDGDAFGDLCDTDRDNDGLENGLDNCPNIPNVDADGNPEQDLDNDGKGNSCDSDDDGDDIPDVLDDCRLSGAADGCDDDIDGDRVPGGVDNCPGISNATQTDQDTDGVGDACDTDIDGDDIPNSSDNCVDVANPSQLDLDRDGRGDAGNWSNGSETCDATECYVIANDEASCLDPNSAFAIYLQVLQGERESVELEVGSEITVALFSNRLGQQHSWTARFDQLPDNTDVTMANGQSSGATGLASPQVTNNLGDISFTPDQPGEYHIKVTASLPSDDMFGRTTASYTVVANVEGEGQGGCAATSGGFAALALGLLVAVRRRRR